MRIRYTLLLVSTVLLALAVGAAGGLALFGRGTDGGAQSAFAQTAALTEVPAGEPVARVASEVGPSAVQINVEVSRDAPYGTERGEGVVLGALRDYAPGENARLTLTRGGEELRVDVPLGERSG